MSFKSSRLKFILLIFAVYQSGCSPTSENGLIGDALKSSSCPSSGCANSTSSVQGILMTSNTNGTITSSGAANRFEFSGECSASTYLYNSISVSVYAGCSGATSNPLGNIDIQSTLGDRQPHCEKGKFSLIMNTSNMGYSQCFTVVAALRAGNSADINSHTFRNDTAAKFSFGYVRNP